MAADTAGARKLLDAAAANDGAAVRRLLAAGVPVDTRDARKRTALLVAATHDAVDAARALIEAGADVNAKDNRRDTPYLFAGAEGRLAILRLTLPTADLGSTNRYGGTALIPACHHGHPETVRALLATAIDIDHVNRLGWTALMETVILGDGGPTFRTILRLLLDAGADTDIPDKDGVTPLAHARKLGFGALAAMLEKAGAKG